MKTLTIRQPWADAIVHGEKRTENRTWTTKYRGTLLIHAGAAPDPKAPIWGPRPDVRSAILATATLAGVHFADGNCCGTWGFPGVYHWELADVTPLAAPVPAKGRLGLWAPTSEQISMVGQATEEMTR
jgi:hypothetical protein